MRCDDDINCAETDDLPVRSADFIIEGQLAVGNFGAASHRGYLRDLGINSVVGLTRTLQGVTPATLGVAAIAVHPMEDGAGNVLDDLRAAVDSITRLVKSRPPVLVHCHAGRSRSVIATAAYLCRARGYDPEAAIAKVATVREVAVAPQLKDLLTAYYNGDCRE